MKEPSYGSSATLVAGTPNANMINDLPVTGIAITATVAGNVSLVLDDGSTLVIAVAVGSAILPLAVIKVNTSGTTATATYAQLA